MAGLSACGSDGPDASSAPGPVETAGAPDTTPAVESAPNGETVEVKALDNTFIEEAVDVAAGTEVVWKNGGRNDHDIVPVADDESWGVGIEAFHPGDQYSHVFTEPGEYTLRAVPNDTLESGQAKFLKVVVQ